MRYDGAAATIGGHAYAVQAATAAYQQQQAAVTNAQQAIDALTTQAVQLLARIARYLLRQAVT